MSKELFWAGLIGITFGLVIAFGVWRVNTSLKPNIASQATPTPQGQQIANEFKVTLDKPAQYDVTTEGTISVEGITRPKIMINVSGETTDYATESEDSGVFKQNVELSPGVNRIKLTAFDQEGNQSIEKVIVVYSSSFEPKSPTPEEGSEATDNAEIRQKVQEKVQAALNKPKAYLGSVTDIADTTIQIKNGTGEIKQISAQEDVAVVNTKGTTSKTVKLTDIAIGDYIVAMGYINGNAVLNAQRILITDEVKDPNYEANAGVVTETSAKTLKLNKVKTGESNEISPTAKTLVYSVSGKEVTKSRTTNIAPDDKIMYVSLKEENSETLRTIFIYPKPTQ